MLLPWSFQTFGTGYAHTLGAPAATAGIAGVEGIEIISFAEQVGAFYQTTFPGAGFITEKLKLLPQ